MRRKRERETPAVDTTVTSDLTNKQCPFSRVAAETRPLATSLSLLRPSFLFLILFFDVNFSSATCAFRSRSLSPLPAASGLRARRQMVAIQADPS